VFRGRPSRAAASLGQSAAAVAARMARKVQEREEASHGRRMEALWTASDAKRLDCDAN
jgi:hypothetical protein